MFKNDHSLLLRCLGMGRRCRRRGEAEAAARPLSECCSSRRVKVCQVSGDRAVCGRMATLGVLPGVVLELLCPAHSPRHCQCVVKVNGGTISLDELAAASIWVEPA